MNSFALYYLIVCKFVFALRYTMETRGKVNVYLIGSYESEILGAKLPSIRQAFSHFMHLHKVVKLTVRDSSRKVIEIVSAFWIKAGIPVRAAKHCIDKLEAIFAEWKGLLKHKSRKTEGHQLKEDQFIERLEDLFDIAHSDALTMITIAEDRAFLLSQRQKGRPGSIGASDNVETNRRKRAQERKEKELKRRKHSQEELETCSSKVLLESDSSTSSVEETDNDDDDDKMKKSPSREMVEGVVFTPRRAKINIMSPGLTSALDRTKISSRNATYVLSEVASSLGHDVNTLNINRNSIQRSRTSHRATQAENLRLEFSSSVPLTVHWDGKLMEDLTSHEHVDRLPVLISGVGVEQLLGVPKLSSGTGEAQASAVVGCLEKWGIEDQVAALCFDTTASNTGHRSGACSLIEHRLNKDLLFLACRHHVMELIVGAAFEKTSIGTSTGPEILIFKRFKDKWGLVNCGDFQTASSDPAVDSLVAPFRSDILEFARTHLQSKQPRADYKEFLELSIIFLGEVPPQGVRFLMPGAMHRARWMSKVIYAIKIWLFRSQFKMTASEERGIRDLATFSVIVHLRAWMTAPFAVEAPLNDFRLMKQLLNYPQSAISASTSKKLGLHLWYLSEELVGLALFDTRIPHESKKLMLAAMEEVAPDHPSKRPSIKSAAFLGDRGLEQFCTTNSKKLFQCLRLPESFLAKDPVHWEEDDSYQKAVQVVQNLAVVNDRAERGVALIQDFNKKLTKDEDQLQFLLQVVTEHRRKFPDCTKRNLLANSHAS